MDAGRRQSRDYRAPEQGTQVSATAWPVYSARASFPTAPPQPRFCFRFIKKRRPAVRLQFQGAYPSHYFFFRPFNGDFVRCVQPGASKNCRARDVGQRFTKRKKKNERGGLGRCAGCPVSLGNGWTACANTTGSCARVAAAAAAARVKNVARECLLRGPAVLDDIIRVTGPLCRGQAAALDKIVAEGYT